MGSENPWKRPIAELTERAFVCREFSAIPPTPESDGVEDVILTAELRQQSGYDAMAGCEVDITEFKGMALDDDGAIGDEHILLFEWSDGTKQGYDLEDGKLIKDESVSENMSGVASLAAAEQRIQKIKHALLAVISN